MSAPINSFSGRKVTDIEIEGIDHSDAPKYCDAFISAAAWDDTGEPLTDAELDILNEDSDLVHESVMAEIY